MSCHNFDDSLFEAIPADQLTRELTAHWRDGHTTPIYKLRREPETLYALESYGPKVAIWMDNETLVQVTQKREHPDYWDGLKKCLELTYCLYHPRRNMRVFISGKTDDAIADTAMFWWGLHCPEECNPAIIIENQSTRFDFSVLKTNQLAAIFANNQKRRLEFNGVRLNAAQSVFLATRDHPIDLTFECEVPFEDGGDAFLSALQTRESQFGSLHYYAENNLRDENWKLLLQLKKTFDRLTFAFWDNDMALLPFSAPVKTLEYAIYCKEVLLAEISSFNIMAEELIVKIHGDTWADGMVVLLRFLGRLSDFSHLKHLALKFEFDDESIVESELAKRILKELIRTIAAHQDLKSLKLDMAHILQERHLKDLCESFESHKGLRTARIKVHPEQEDYDYSWFMRLLSRNRRIQVRGNWVNWAVDAQELEDLYSFNRFYNDSQSLREVSQALRTTLVGTALTQNASANLQRSAFLMSSYTDSLCEFVQSADTSSLAVSEHTMSDERNTQLEYVDGPSQSKRRRF